MSGLDEIVDRAIDYTNRILKDMPSYREAALAGLRKLRAGLAEKSPRDPALKRLDDYLEGLPARRSSTQ